MNGIIAGNKNIITKDNLAKLRRFILGSGVFMSPEDGNNFGITIYYAKNKITVGKGALCVDGYGAYSKETSFDFVDAATEQNWIIYAELNMSENPNELILKKINIGRATDRKFRQDNLAVERSGVFQLPLWRVNITNQGVQGATDLRNLDAYVVSKGNFSLIILPGLVVPDYVYTKYEFDWKTGSFTLNETDKIADSSMSQNVEYFYKSSGVLYGVYKTTRILTLWYNRRYDPVKSSTPTAFVKIKNVKNCVDAVSLDGLNPVIDSAVTAVTQSTNVSDTSVATTAYVHNKIDSMI